MRIGNDLELRSLEAEHALELYALVDSSRMHLRQWLPFVDNYESVSAARDFIRSFQERASKKEDMAFGIWFGGKLAGVVTYDYIDLSNRSTLVGYWLGEWFQGKGIMTRSCEAIVDHAFKELRLNRVEILCA